jgi:serine O-acetyltransferase
VTLKELLYADLARQYELAGLPQIRPNFLRLLARALHFRFLPNILCRFSRSAYLVGVPLVPYFFTYLNIILFGIEITPKCEIDGGLFFPHPQGTVIGARRVGRNVTFVQGVMVGAITQDMAFTPEQRPLIGDNVMLNAGSKVLGGIEIGDGATVGANSLVIRSVPPDTTVMGVPAKVIFRQVDPNSGPRLGEEYSRSTDN